jgi:hypothetical protein
MPITQHPASLQVSAAGTAVRQADEHVDQDPVEPAVIDKTRQGLYE